MNLVSEKLNGKSVLVTGACGTVGSELIRQLATSTDFTPSDIIGLDNSESELFFLDQQYLDNPNVRLFVSDIRNQTDLTRKMIGVDIVFHCAALKHVVLCERSPDQAIMTNIQGVQNVIAAAEANNVETVIFTSSDKAVNPTNVMGTSKLMGERLMTAANSDQRKQGPVFASTRFGNVLGSNGSVIPIFHNQIVKGGPVTLTHGDMTRFVMSIKDAVRLVLDSAAYVRGGEVFVTKMPVLRIEDLAKAMIAELAPRYGHKPEDVEIVQIGTKPGEKLYEELMSDEETRRSVELERYYSVLPAFRGMYHDIDYTYPGFITDDVTNPYISSVEPALNLTEVRELLHAYELLGTPDGAEAERYWPGDKEEASKASESEKSGRAVRDMSA